MRRRIVVVLVAGALTVSGFVAQSVGRPPAAVASSTSPSIATGTLLTNTTLGGASQVDQVDMLSPTLGYALATHYVDHDYYRFYLVRTTDLARTWTVQSQIPGVDGRYPIFTDFGTFNSDPQIDFINRNVGYVAGQGGLIYVTDDGGLSWKSIAAVGSSTSYGVSGSTTSVVSTTCARTHHSTTQKCKSELTQYAVGSTIPSRTSSIPGATRPGPLVALLAVAPSTQVINEDNDTQSTATSLFLTHDDGRVWTQLQNPCHGLLIEQLVVSTSGSWLLSCFLDEGSYHGTAKIFRTSDDGVTWTTVQDLAANGDGSPVYLFYNGDDRVLFSVGMNPAGGVSSSTDGGRHWSPDQVLGYTEGGAGSFTNFGPASSLYQIYQGPMFVTSNSRTWRIVRPLVAGTYRGLSICTSRDTKVSLRRDKVGAQTYTYVDFTNTSTTSCYLDGAPNVQPLGANGASAGPADATDMVDSEGNFVTLKGDGGVASTAMFVDRATGYTPTSSCRLANAASLRITFGSPSEFVLNSRTHPFSVCTVFSSISIDAVSAGPGRP
jgi:hypothetical protein